MKSKFKIVNWNSNLDLEDFYSRAIEKGFVNNSSQKRMIDCFRNEKEWSAWILYKNERAIGSVASHSFDRIMGPNSFRVLARTCILEGVRSNGLMVAKTAIKQHQNMTDQFLLPACLNWINNRGRVFATSNSNDEGSQRLVHNYYFPILEEIGIVSKIKEVYYRYTHQTVWEIHVDRFYENLNKYPRW
jgi:hypothetical protein